MQLQSVSRSPKLGQGCMCFRVQDMKFLGVISPLCKVIDAETPLSQFAYSLWVYHFLLLQCNWDLGISTKARTSDPIYPLWWHLTFSSDRVLPLQVQPVSKIPGPLSQDPKICSLQLLWCLRSLHISSKASHPSSVELIVHLLSRSTVLKPMHVSPHWISINLFFFQISNQRRKFI